MNSKEILPSLEEMLDIMKKEKDEKYDAFYCYYMCMKAGFLSEAMDGEFIKEDVDQGWELWEYFMNTRLKTVYEYDNSLPRELSSDLVEHFCICKARLHSDLGTYMEDEIAAMRDVVLDKVGGASMFDSYEDTEVIGRDKDILNSMKGDAYTTILLEKYFTNKAGKSSLELFVSDVLSYGSFYIALRETKVRVLQKTIISEYDKFCLYQLIERYITFSFEFGDEYRSYLQDVFEYGLTQYRMDMYSREFSKKNILTIFNLVASLFVGRFHSSYYMEADDIILEYCIICLAPFSFTRKGCDIGYYLKEMKITMDSEGNRLCKGLYNIMIYEKPMIIESGFYGSYAGRFTLKEFRLRSLMNEQGEDMDFVGARKSLKQLKKYSGFFRYEFHCKIIDIKELSENITTAIDVEEITKARMLFADFKDKVNDVRAFVVGSYPVGQINDVLLKLYSIDYVIGEFNQQLYNVPFDQEKFRNEYEKKAEELLGLPQGVVKVGRNDPCYCGSGKKYKKCCLNT